MTAPDTAQVPTGPSDGDPAVAGARLIGPTDRCQSVLIVSTAGNIRTVTRYVQCRRHGAHAGLHFASWGGSQKWRQAEWSNTEPNATTVSAVPRGRRVW